MAIEFHLLEHSSDIGVCGRGATREEALIAVSKGLTSILVNPETFRPLEERYFKATGIDESAQIVNWLNEMLFFFDTEGLIFVEFKIASWSAGEITGYGWGEFLDLTRHEFRTAVKAATYHQFESRQIRDGWEIKVFVDV